MDGMTNLPCSSTNMEALHRLVPGLRDIAPEAKMDHVTRHLQTMCQAMPGAMSAMSAALGSPAEIATMSQADIISAAQKNIDKWKQDSALLASKAPPLSARETEMIRRSVTEKIAEGEAAGTLTPDQAKEAVKILVGDKGQPATMFMSGATETDIPALDMATLLCSITPAPLGGRRVTRTIPGETTPAATAKLPYETVSERNKPAGGVFKM
jgi:hypothetical protein